MADDCDAPHTKVIEFSGKPTLGQLAAQIIDMRYLAHIAGGKAAWLLEADGQRVAVIAQQWARPAFVAQMARLPAPASVHLVYKAQQDPIRLASQIGAVAPGLRRFWQLLPGM